MTFGPWRPDDSGRVGREARQSRSVHRAPKLGPRALERASDRQRISDRIRVIEWTVAGVFIVLVLGFWQIQVVHGGYWTQKAEQNQHSSSRIRPARGLILDRNGEILARNLPAYEVGLVREATEDIDGELAYLTEMLGLPAGVMHERLEAGRGVPAFRPIVLATGVDPSTVVKLQARRREHPGIVVQIEPRRLYPMGSLAAHVLGYVGEVSAEQLRIWGDPFRIGDIVGQRGVEGMYNDQLSGSPGERYAVVNNTGREVELLREDAPLPGETVFLTLDAKLQQKAEELLGERRGAVVVLNARTGGILTMASTPRFDPNLFAARFSQAEWEALVTDPARPMRNRALQENHAPGSIFKLVVAAAGLEEGVIDANTSYFCPGQFMFGGRAFRCLGQHGNITVVDALAHSCNVFFYELGTRLGRERIVRWAQRFGLGDLTGIDLPNEVSGIVPSDEYLEANRRPYYPGETVSLSIGQGPLAVSPLQQAHLAATAATGFVRRPHLLLRIERSAAGGRSTRGYPVETRAAALSERTRQLLLRGMSGSVNHGTSARARLQGVAVGGKTGTAQVASRDRVAADNADRPPELRNHAWFVAVAPIDDPEIALAVFIEHGGSGGVVATPVGAEILAAYFGTEVAYRPMPVPEATAQPTRTGANDR